MKYSVFFSTIAAKQLSRLGSETQQRIEAAVGRLADNPRPPGCVKMRGREGYRIRVGSYRIIYTIDDDALIVEIVEVGNRGEIY